MDEAKFDEGINAQNSDSIIDEEVKKSICIQSEVRQISLNHREKDYEKYNLAFNALRNALDVFQRTEELENELGLKIKQKMQIKTAMDVENCKSNVIVEQSEKDINELERRLIDLSDQFHDEIDHKMTNFQNLRKEFDEAQNPSEKIKSIENAIKTQLESFDHLKKHHSNFPDILSEKKDVNFSDCNLDEITLNGSYNEIVIKKLEQTEKEIRLTKRNIQYMEQKFCKNRFNAAGKSIL